MDTGLRTADTTALAYIGDAVYEVYIRKHAIEGAHTKTSEINDRAVSFVNANSQAACVRKLMSDGFLTEDELVMVKRARNRTNTAHPRGATPTEYKLATGFEALIGWLYMTGMTERLEEVVTQSIKITEGRMTYLKMI